MEDRAGRQRRAFFYKRFSLEAVAAPVLLDSGQGGHVGPSNWTGPRLQMSSVGTGMIASHYEEV